MMLPCTAVFGAPVCKDPQEPDIMLLIKGDHTVIQQVCGNQSVLPVIEFGLGHLCIGVNKSLLVYPAYSFYGSHIIGVLRTKITGVVCFNLPMGFLLFLCLFQRCDLGLCKHNPILGDSGFQCF